MTTIHAFLVLLSACGFIALAFGFWLLVAKDEFIESCQRYVTKDEEPESATFLPKTVHFTGE